MNRQIGRLEVRLIQDRAHRENAEREAATELARAKDLKIQLEDKERVIRAKDAFLADRADTMDALGDEFF